MRKSCLCCKGHSARGAALDWPLVWLRVTVTRQRAAPPGPVRMECTPRAPDRARRAALEFELPSRTAAGPRTCWESPSFSKGVRATPSPTPGRCPGLLHTWLTCAGSAFPPGWVVCGGQGRATFPAGSSAVSHPCRVDRPAREERGCGALAPLNLWLLRQKFKTTISLLRTKAISFSVFL